MSDIGLTGGPIDSIIDSALAEDIGRGDITSEILIPAELSGKASMLVKADGVLAGIEVAARIFQRIEPEIEIDVLIKDGVTIKKGDIAAIITGKTISILKGERVALNFIQRMSGIATMTARYVAEIKGYSARIYDTRKTTPGLRLLEKYAVRMGGGCNHRMGLDDAVLIKDNHLSALRALGMNLIEIVTKARRNAPPKTTIEVEVTNLGEVNEAVESGADVIMLDNMSLEEMGKAVKVIDGRARVEASGGITLDNVRQVAATGVDIISIGALTHSVKALDISLEFGPQTLPLV